MFALLKLGHATPPLFLLAIPGFLACYLSVMTGAQAEASRAIGHDLALIGVPAPTTLDGFRPASPDEIKTFMVSVGLSPERGEDVAKALKDKLNITSIVQYEWWLGEYSFKSGSTPTTRGKPTRPCSSPWPML